MNHRDFGVVTAILLKTDPVQPKRQDDQEAPEKKEREKFEEDWYVCRNCRKRITKPANRAIIQGSHSHTFANPSGIVYEIVCFSTAQGYSFLGPPSQDFTWFSGHSWRIVICADCLIHLGWYFSGSDGGSFFGFIVDRIVRHETNG